MNEFQAILKKEHMLRDVYGINFLDLKVLVDINGSYEWHEYKVLRRSIGLEDKNGEMLYTGDICKFYHHPKDVVVISYDEELLSYKATVVSEGVFCEDYFFIKKDSKKYERIGNIYENSELLK